MAVDQNTITDHGTDLIATIVNSATASKISLGLVLLVLALLVTWLCRGGLVAGILALARRAATTTDPAQADQTIRAMEVVARALEALRSDKTPPPG